jgi:hypothetical protein
MHPHDRVHAVFTDEFSLRPVKSASIDAAQFVG